MTGSLRERPAVRRVLGAAIAATVVCGVLAAVSRGDAKTVTGAGRVDTNGSVVVTPAGAQSYVLGGSANLHEGDVVEAREGTMTVRLIDGAVLEGLPKSDESDATRVRAGAVPELVRGELLVTAPRGTTVDSAGNHVTTTPTGEEAAIRLERSLALHISSYRGSATIDSAGQVRVVPALRAMEVAVLGQPPSSPKALGLAHPDNWDRRFLGEAIDLGQTLQSLSNAYSPTLRPDEGRSAAFYQNLLPALSGARGYDDRLVQLSAGRPQGEILVASAIAALGQQGELANRWRSLFAFRDDGATWGLVALDQHVAIGPLVAAVNAAVDRTTFQFAAAVPTPPAPVAADGVPARDPAAPADAPAPEPTARPGPVTPTLPNEGPGSVVVKVPEPAPGETQPPADGGLVGGLVDVLGNLLGGLLGP
ncbi:MAG: hypothetical protein ABIV94_12020 [Acidimicrobiales bacterium]